MDSVLTIIVVVSGIVFWIGIVVLCFVFKVINELLFNPSVVIKNILKLIQDRLCKFKDEYKSVNLEGILPHTRNSFTGKRKSSLTKLADLERAQIFRDRAKVTLKFERPQFKLSKKSLESLYPPDKFGNFGGTRFLSSSPRADSSSCCSHTRMVLYNCPKILAVDDILESDPAERKYGDVEIEEGMSNQMF